MDQYSVYDCTIIELPRLGERSGNITAINNLNEVPFEVQRVYYLYDIPGGESRGAHAHKELQQLIVAASGSFDVNLFDGEYKKTFHLSRPYTGLHIMPGIWRDLDNFCSGSICLTLASLPYNEDDYIRDYSEFLKYKSH